MLDKGSFINHVVKFLGIFDPLPPSWSLLLNKAYVIKWSFGQPPLPPQMSTWFMNDPPLRCPMSKLIKQFRAFLMSHRRAFPL